MSAAPELADLPEFILGEVQPVRPAPAAPELVWELPAAASPAASVEASQPVPESVWQPQPQAPARKSVAAPREPNLIERALSGAR
ncbi:hypothetical protein, partial [Pseudomonas protegens]|uniref:hypothetical protein n=1 Tax=Pseudomonas protegens TaxID=380021 RepID=UPI0021824B24